MPYQDFDDSEYVNQTFKQSNGILQYSGVSVERIWCSFDAPISPSSPKASY